MSRKEVRRENLKFFRPIDGIIYSVVLFIAVILLAIFVFPKKTASLTGFEVYYDNDLILTYFFGDEEPDINSIYSTNFRIVSTDDGFTVELTDVGHDGYENEILVNDNEKWVKMNDANCHGRDCVYTSKITKSGDIIICYPHKLKVVGIGNAKPTNEIEVG